jgi:hypothetical protein
VKLTASQAVEIKVAVIKALVKASMDTNCNVREFAESVTRAVDP